MSIFLIILAILGPAQDHIGIILKKIYLYWGKVWKLLSIVSKSMRLGILFYKSGSSFKPFQLVLFLKKEMAPSYCTTEKFPVLNKFEHFSY